MCQRQFWKPQTKLFIWVKPPAPVAILYMRTDFYFKEKPPDAVNIFPESWSHLELNQLSFFSLTGNQERDHLILFSFRLAELAWLRGL